jgi:hypothetical protein
MDPGRIGHDGGISSIFEFLSPSSHNTRVAPVLKSIVQEYASEAGTLHIGKVSENDGWMSQQETMRIQTSVSKIHYLGVYMCV